MEIAQKYKTALLLPLELCSKRPSFDGPTLGTALASEKGLFCSFSWISGCEDLHSYLVSGVWNAGEEGVALHPVGWESQN